MEAIVKIAVASEGGIVADAIGVEARHVVPAAAPLMKA